MGWMIGVQFLTEAGIFLFITTSRPTVGPTQPPMTWILDALFLDIKAVRV
jgi:hypothetical protein